MNRDLITCVAYGLVAVLAGTACHWLSPMLGIVVMPMFWPLAALTGRVAPMKAAATAAVVPYVSSALTGMPVTPSVVAVKFVVLTLLTVGIWRLVRAKK